MINQDIYIGSQSLLLQTDTTQNCRGLIKCAMGVYWRTALRLVLLSSTEPSKWPAHVPFCSHRHASPSAIILARAHP